MRNRSSKPAPIVIEGARQNNLKNISIQIPARQLSVITGLSGSGKSSLAFDTLYAEGQRRYIESLSTYTRQFLEKMPKPDLDSIRNIPPSIALEQRNQVLNSRSTVGTQTEVVDYLRVLFAKVGKTHCLDCGGSVKDINAQSILETALNWFQGRKGAIATPLLQRIRKKKTKKASLLSLFQILREQGLRRAISLNTRGKGEVIDLEDVGELDRKALERLDKAQSSGRIFIVIDRLRIKKGEKEEVRTRLLDSIEQALAIGRGELFFYDLENWEKLKFKCQFACEQCGKEHRHPEPNLFSFNSPLGACSNCSGFGYTLDIDEHLVVPDPSKTLKNGAIDPFAKPSLADWQKNLFRFAERHGISIGKRYRELTPKQKKLLWEGDPNDPLFPGILACFQELTRWKYKIHVRVFIRRYQSQNICQNCQGTRIKAEALAVKIANASIADLTSYSLTNLEEWFKKLKISKREEKIASEALAQVRRRLSFLNVVGVGYLTLSRLTKTLSGGEFQRINLATQLGNGLCGTLYVLDEPSIGLHAADTERLIHVLKDLRDQGNTLAVVEHDLDVIRAADWLVELGPGAGRRGGELICQGDSKKMETTRGSITGKYLSGSFSIERSVPLRAKSIKQLKLTRCNENNLKKIDVVFPLERFVVVTGVSGSGKSTLVHKTLYQALMKNREAGEFDRLYGAENISEVILLDQKPIGKNSRSNPATYLKAWDEIRKTYANQVLSLRRGYTPQFFSFNVDGGRCSVCKGEGEITLDMHFMAEMKLPCEECDGKRFKKNILDVEYRGKNISRLLNTTIDEAYDLFRDNPVLLRKLGILREVGLGYLKLGQSATTLSGGESQRLKIASVLDTQGGKGRARVLYIFDEPTTGLHLEDIKKLLFVLQDLVQSGNSVIMIEHHLDVIAQSDWVIDLGPGGGTQGGALVAAGTPAQIWNHSKSITGQMLRKSGYQFPARS